MQPKFNEMTFNKKNDQEKSDQEHGDKRVRRSPDKRSSYKTEKTGRTEYKRKFEKDDRRKPFKSYPDERNDDASNDKPRVVKNKDFTRDNTDKRRSRSAEDRPGSYSNYRKNRSSDYGKSDYKRRDDKDKREDRSSGTTARPYTRTRISRNTESGRDKPFRSEDSDKRAERYSNIRSRPFTGNREKRDSEPGTDKPFNREGSEWRKNKFSDTRSRPYIRREKSSSEPGSDKPYSKEGSDRRQTRYSDSRSRPYSPKRENHNSEPGKDDFQSRGTRPYRKEGTEGRHTKFSPKDRKPRSSFENRKPGISTQSKPRTDSDLIRLNRYISTSGICSRREADDLITAGLITVNGKIVNELGSKVSIHDDVKYNGEHIKKERDVYILLNKPKEYVTTLKDPYAKHTVLDLIKGACKERVFPVGRLDRNTTGVLLMTNDGELTKKLTHPSFNRKKIYHVFIDKNLKAPDLEAITNGIELEDGFIKVDDISFVTVDDRKQVGVEIHSGRNRIVRRIFEQLGYRVIRLDRVYFAGLTKKGLQRGHWRFLTNQEVGMLKMGSFK